MALYYDEGPGWGEFDAFLYEEHSPDCECSHCMPELHGPVPEYWTKHDGKEDGDYTVYEGWLIE